MDALGRHILVEFFGCTPPLLNDVTHIERSMVKAATDAGLTIINTSFHHFSPYGSMKIFSAAVVPMVTAVRPFG